ncbi:T9SS type A sorting domain-containing protein [Hymenobacter humi]|uniref:T9SS type A sorting domain-containing protein n=1 Tax=Hymenobacter humi TaxID=1411620 RepID=A0ABW2UAB8_9BACT
MAATALGAQAQITLDGKVTAAEIATAKTADKYQSISTYSGTHSVAGKGLQTLYVGNSATKLYVAVVGSFQQTATYAAVLLYLNVPGKTGVAKGVKLAGGAAGDSPLKIKPTMDFEVDYGVRVNFDIDAAKGGYFSFADYSNGNPATGGVPDTYQGNVLPGTPLTASGTTAATAGPLLGARVAYTNAATVSANTDNSAIEFEFDLAAMGLTATSAIDMFVAYTNGDGILTSDTFPPIAGQATALAPDQDFTAIAGNQYLTYNLTTGLLANRNEVARSLRFGVYPNPGSAVAVTYTVPQGNQAVSLSVHDATGKQVRSLNASQAGVQTYKLSGLKAGIYVVKLNVGGEQTSSKVVIE